MKKQWLKPMIPTLVDEIPTGDDWVYETKYDGFRGLLYVCEHETQLISRNLHSLRKSFPEIIKVIDERKHLISSMLPIILDGEIAILSSSYKANFKDIQLRGRTKRNEQIKQFMETKPAHFLAFDLLKIKGNHITTLPLIERKERLYFLIKKMNLPLYVNKQNKELLQYIPYSTNHSTLWNKIKEEEGEGIVIKKKTSKWVSGKRTRNWLKVKNWITQVFVVTGYEKSNGYFHVGLVEKGTIKTAGLFSHGMSVEEKHALYQIICKNQRNENNDFITVQPGICVELQFLEWYDNQIRQPRFVRFRFDMDWEDCTWEAKLIDK